MESENLPEALVVPMPEKSWWPLLPFFVILVVFVVILQQFGNRPIAIQIKFQQGHSLKAGDLLKYRGISIGAVSEVRLSSNLENVLVKVDVDSNLTNIARGGSCFWIVRPRAGMSGISGWETIVGPRFIAVNPGIGSYQTEFVGLEEPPVLEERSSGGLEIVLYASRKGSLRPGAPITFRQIPIGTLLSIGLSGDSLNVEARAYIEPAYKGIVRKNSKFWNSSGFDVNLGLLDGINLNVESLQTLISGGVSMATPDEPQDQVHTGHRFQLFEHSEKEWLTWHPPLTVGKDFFPAGTEIPSPSRIRVTWTKSMVGGLIQREEERWGWGLLVNGGILVPKDLVAFSIDSRKNVRFEIEGEVYNYPLKFPKESENLVVAAVKATRKPWAIERCRKPAKVEDCIGIADPALSSIPLQAFRLKDEGGIWRVDSSVTIHPNFHGASVVSQKDGLLLGMLMINGQGAVSVAILPENLSSEVSAK